MLTRNFCDLKKTSLVLGSSQVFNRHTNLIKIVSIRVFCLQFESPKWTILWFSKCIAPTSSTSPSPKVESATIQNSHSAQGSCEVRKVKKRSFKVRRKLSELSDANWVTPWTQNFQGHRELDGVREHRVSQLERHIARVANQKLSNFIQLVKIFYCYALRANLRLGDLPPEGFATIGWKRTGHSKIHIFQFTSKLTHRSQNDCDRESIQRWWLFWNY